MRLTETLDNDIHNHASINLLERFWLLFGLLNTHKSLTVQYEHKTKEDLIFRKDFQNSKYVNEKSRKKTPPLINQKIGRKGGGLSSEYL